MSITVRERRDTRNQDLHVAPVRPVPLEQHIRDFKGGLMQEQQKESKEPGQ